MLNATIDDKKDYLQKMSIHRFCKIAWGTESSWPLFLVSSRYRVGSFWNEKRLCKIHISTKSNSSQNQLVENITKAIESQYHKLIGSNNTGIEFDNLNTSQNVCLGAIEKRKQKQRQLDELNSKLRKTRIPQNLSSEAINLMDEVSELERQEQEAFSRLSTVVIKLQEAKTDEENHLKRLALMFTFLSSLVSVIVLSLLINSSSKANKIKAMLLEREENTDRGNNDSTNEMISRLDAKIDSLLNIQKETLSFKEQKHNEDVEKETRIESLETTEKSLNCNAVEPEESLISRPEVDKISNTLNSLSVFWSDMAEKQNDAFQKMILSLEELKKHQMMNTNQSMAVADISEKLSAIDNNQRYLTSHLKEWKEKTGMNQIGCIIVRPCVDVNLD